MSGNDLTSFKLLGVGTRRDKESMSAEVNQHQPIRDQDTMREKSRPVREQDTMIPTPTRDNLTQKHPLVSTGEGQGRGKISFLFIF